MKWKLKNGQTITLLTPAQLAQEPPGSVLTTIDGTTVVVGQDYIDEDTRAGYTAFGKLE